MRLHEKEIINNFYGKFLDYPKTEFVIAFFYFLFANKK